MYCTYYMYDRSISVSMVLYLDKVVLGIFSLRWEYECRPFLESGIRLKKALEGFFRKITWNYGIFNSLEPEFF